METGLTYDSVAVDLSLDPNNRPLTPLSPGISSRWLKGLESGIWIPACWRHTVKRSGRKSDVADLQADMNARFFTVMTAVFALVTPM